MKIRLDFVPRSDDYELESYYNDDHDDDDDDGPLQLIRPMPDTLSTYVTAKDYEDFCIQKIDPLLEELYETEESTRRWLMCLRLFSFVLFLFAGFAIFIRDFGIFLIIWCIVAALIMNSIFVRCNYSGRIIEDEIRSECEQMSNRCNSNNNSAKSANTHFVFFDLVMKRVWEASDENGHIYNRRVSHMNVTILDKKSYEYDGPDDPEHPSCC